MKTIKFYLSLAVLIAALSSCSTEKGGNKEIEPVSTEFSSGELAKYVVFVQEPCEMTYSEKDGAIPSQTFRLKTKMEKIKEGYEDVDYHDIRFTGLLVGADINLVDESGAKIVSLDLSDEGSLALKKLLTSNVGETAEVIFSGEFHNSDDAPNWYKNATGFSPYLAGDIYVESQNQSGAGEATASESSASDESSFDLENVLLPSSLKGKVEVISAEKGVGSYGYPEMTITFKLLKTVNTSSLCSAYGQMWIVGVGQTENGVDVKQLMPSYNEWRSGDSEGSEFKDFLEGDPDSTITMVFTGGNDDSSDVAADLEKVKKFKLKLTK